MCFDCDFETLTKVELNRYLEGQQVIKQVHQYVLNLVSFMLSLQPVTFFSGSYTFIFV